MSIATRLETVRQQIDAACKSCGRDPSSVRLIAVSKKKPASDIEAAFAAGQRLFGESYVQELAEKAPQIGSPVEWHFIGGLQSNKVKYLRGLVSLIHSVDRFSLAQEISRQWTKIDATAEILLQFNLGMEETKRGAAEAEALELARKVSALPGVKVRGLMTLPPWDADPEEVRPYFRRLKNLAHTIEAAGQPNVEMKELSMGMSHDFTAAIEEGATLVRVGTAIFGERQ